MRGADNTAGALTVKVLRAANDAPDTGTVRALDLKGLPLGDTTFTFKPDERETEAELTLPVEIRNDIARLEIAGERSAGAVALLDKRWRRRTDRRRHRLDRRYRAAAAGRHLLSRRARSTRSPTCGSPSAARRRRR